MKLWGNPFLYCVVDWNAFIFHVYTEPFSPSQITIYTLPEMQKLNILIMKFTERGKAQEGNIF